ncbi:MAG TPA: PilZ domain-containing protein [Myxococcota bacterium]|nr:PilZ domain-containing protein [Myxococcota bacterium]
MAAAEGLQLALDFSDQEQRITLQRASRGETREQLVRLVEYAPFPRSSAEQRTRIAFTRDVSLSGLCLGATSAEPVGSVLHLTVRSIDGRPALETLARVAWCASDSEGRFLVGLHLVGERRAGMRLVRRPASTSTLRVATGA